MTPVHFSVQEALEKHKRMVDDMAKRGNVPGVEIQVRAANLVGRAFVEFIVGERNLETADMLVAGATAAAVANIIETLTQNFPGPATALMFSKVLQSRDRVRFEDCAKVHGTPGGRA
ncbi:hypothetical protein LB566_23335 [Mesorhizobium sp. CA13]|uniref:hypothetical protein n=1 Tax=Mesorhizobium sp. CA13 TaxID=2876643 RepID=UPI001CCA11FD|nr:hypothetical protein [Mesorhizobium sp. CA13]MBZ9856729.1 hypothetical protein [Mesorhizobium sp. CA13]